MMDSTMDTQWHPNKGLNRAITKGPTSMPIVVATDKLAQLIAPIPLSPRCGSNHVDPMSGTLDHQFRPATASVALFSISYILSAAEEPLLSAYPRHAIHNEKHAKIRLPL